MTGFPGSVLKPNFVAMKISSLFPVFLNLQCEYKRWGQKGWKN